MQSTNQVIAHDQVLGSSEAKTIASAMYLSLMTRSEVLERIKISRAALYAKLNPLDPSYDSTFPVPIRVGTRAVRWIESEVDSYIASLPRARRIGGAE